MSAAIHASPREAAAETLALTLWGEAADRPVRAIEALAALVMNRLRAGVPHWGNGVVGVCRAPFQFPCWNRNHPRHARLREIPCGRRGTRDLPAHRRARAGRRAAGPDLARPSFTTRWRCRAGRWRRPAAAEIGGICAILPRAPDLA